MRCKAQVSTKATTATTVECGENSEEGSSEAGGSAEGVADSGELEEGSGSDKLEAWRQHRGSNSSRSWSTRGSSGVETLWSLGPEKQWSSGVVKRL